MLVKRVVGVSLLALSGLALAQQGVRTTSAGPQGPPAAPAPAADRMAGEAAVRPGGPPGLDLAPRRPVPKTPTPALRVPDDATGELVVKFRDDVRARPAAAGLVESRTGRNLDPFQAIVEQFGLTVKPAFRWTEQRLRNLEQRAESFSGKAQPDLAGYVTVEAPEGGLLAAAKAINDLGTVEFVSFQRQWRVQQPATGACCRANAQGSPICDIRTEQECMNLGGAYDGDGTDCMTTGACCLTNGTCVNVKDTCCILVGGDYQGDGTDCANDPCAMTGDCLPGDCFEIHDTRGCGDQECCDTVCAVVDACCDEDAIEPIWDQLCVDYANLLCEGGDTCVVSFNESCFEGHALPGCLETACCNTVCAADPFCCDMDGFWDDACADLANELCLTDVGEGGSPLLTAWQGYLRPTTYAQQAGGVPDGTQLGTPLFTNMGDGWNLRGSNYALWVINEVLADPDLVNGDANGDGAVSLSDDEFVEIVNNFDVDLDISGWTLRDCDDFDMDGCTIDEETVRHVFPAGTVVKAQRAIVVFGGGTPTGDFGADTVVQVASTGALALNDFGNDETVVIRDLNERRMTTLSYAAADAGNNMSLTRFPDVSGLDSLVQHATVAPDGELFSPGTHIDASPFADSLEGIYGLSRELFEGFGVGETDPPGSSDYNDLKYNARGKGVNVAVIEWAFWANHEDLDVTTEPGQTLLPIIENEPNHATACLGVIGARDDAHGVTGIAPESNLFFFPLTSIEEGPRLPEAFLSAYETLGPGDVVSCSFGPSVNLNNGAFTWTLLRMGSDLGITTCVAAANECDDLGNTAMDLGDSGAVVVGAGDPGAPYCRRSFSNYFTGDADAELSNIVHVQAWGVGVTTAGYGTLFFPGADPALSYTKSFNGTSSATPQIAGLAACLQGLAKQFHGIPLMPEQIRAALTNVPADGSFNQCQILDPEELPGFPTELECGPDFDPNEGPNKIGPYPRAGRGFTSASGFIVNQSGGGFTDSPLVEGIEVLQGTLLFGNVNSVKGSDNNYLVVNSQFNAEGGGSGGNIGTGEITDVQIEIRPEIPIVNSMQIDVESFISGADGGSAIVVAFLFDWDDTIWRAGGVGLLTQIDPCNEVFGPCSPVEHLIFDVTNARRFVRNSDRLVLMRLWTLTGGVSGPHQVFHDWANLSVGGGTPFISPPGGGGGL